MGLGQEARRHLGRDPQRLGLARQHQPGPAGHSGIEREVAAAAERLQVFTGVPIPVARAGHLIALKVLARDDTRRPQDALDLRGLVGIASGADLSLARSGVRLISQRGFHRGRDLPAELEAAIAAFRRSA